jgi:hypothetical protein
MAKLLPPLRHPLAATPGRRVPPPFLADFVAMSSAQLLAAGWSIARDNAIYVPDSAGDYAEVASGVIAKSDLGVMCFGAFVNYARNGLLTGAMAGSPGTMPTGWTEYNFTRTAVAVGSHNGLPLLTIEGSTPAAAGTYDNNATFTTADGDILHGSGYFGFGSSALGTAYVYLQDDWSDNSHLGCTSAPAIALRQLSRTVNVITGGDDFSNFRGHINTSAAGTVEFQIAGKQVVKNIGLHPKVLALSGSTTTETAAQIPVLSRVTPGECSFVLPVITSPGRKGTDDVIASASLDANNQLLVIHENANNNILLRLVTAGSTVGEVDLGIVGDNVYTVISGSVAIGRLAGALEGMSEMIEVTGSGIIPPPAFMRWTLGNDHSQAAATQFWGSVSGLRIN